MIYSLILSVLLYQCLTYLYISEQDIIRLPRLFRFLQRPLAQFISVLRAPKSKEGYASIGGGSPLRQITDAQAGLFILIYSLFHSASLITFLCKDLWFLVH